jgi:hypothetical protein
MIPRRVLYALVAICVSVVGVGAGAVLYADHVATESNRKWCGIMSTLDDAYVQARPTTSAGQKIAREIHRLRTDFGC